MVQKRNPVNDLAGKPEGKRLLVSPGHRREDNIKRVIIIIFIYCNWAVTRWQWLFYMYTKLETGYY